MNRLYSLILCTCFTFILCSCKKKCEENDDKLTINKTNYSGSLNTDGYYYMDDEEQGRYVLFFYKNGTVLLYYFTDIESFEANISGLKHDKNNWGAFLIQNDDITIQRWANGKCGFPVYVNNGKIQNDSTIVINETYRVINKENYLKKNNVLNFKRTASKPDSTQPYL